MRAVLLLLALLTAMASAQTISPCITSCVTQFCPKGVSDVPCFCYGTTAKDIAICIPNRCNDAAAAQAPKLWDQFCMTSMKACGTLCSN